MRRSEHAIAIMRRGVFSMPPWPRAVVVWLATCAVVPCLRPEFLPFTDAALFTERASVVHRCSARADSSTPWPPAERLLLLRYYGLRGDSIGWPAPAIGALAREPTLNLWGAPLDVDRLRSALRDTLAVQGAPGSLHIQCERWGAIDAQRVGQLDTISFDVHAD
jgi:hypothetical protein